MYIYVHVDNEREREKHIAMSGGVVPNTSTLKYTLRVSSDQVACGFASDSEASGVATEQDEPMIQEREDRLEGYFQPKPTEARNGGGVVD